MTEIQKMKMELLDKFGIVDDPKSVDFCREAYKFLAEGDTTVGIDPANLEINPLNWETTIPTEDGIYLVFADGSKRLFDGKTPDEAAEGKVTGIGVKRGGWALVVDLHDQAESEDIALTIKNEGTGHYFETYLDAVADWNGKENTKGLEKILNPNICLKDDQWIPSLGEMYFIFLNRKAINEALEAVGGTAIEGVWFWTSTEYSAPTAWRLGLSNGNAYGNTKASNTLHVRPVSAFIS